MRPPTTNVYKNDLVTSSIEDADVSVIDFLFEHPTSEWILPAHCAEHVTGIALVSYPGVYCPCSSHWWLVAQTYCKIQFWCRGSLASQSPPCTNILACCSAGDNRSTQPYAWNDKNHRYQSNSGNCEHNVRLQYIVQDMTTILTCIQIIPCSKYK